MVVGGLVVVVGDGGEVVVVGVVVGGLVVVASIRQIHSSVQPSYDYMCIKVRFRHI